jgi:hypothetical protein
MPPFFESSHAISSSFRLLEIFRTYNEDVDLQVTRYYNVIT